MKTVTFDEEKWKLVPIQQTPEMQQAGIDASIFFDVRGPSQDDAANIALIWTAMVNAASSAQQSLPRLKVKVFERKTHTGTAWTYERAPSGSMFCSKIDAEKHAIENGFDIAPSARQESEK